MQAALNAAGYTDEAKKPLVEDGKWGKKSQFAFERLLEITLNPNLLKNSP